MALLTISKAKATITTTTTMINQLISEVENALGMGSPIRRKKRGTTSKRRTYRAPARRTVAKRKTKRTTRRRY